MNHINLAKIYLTTLATIALNSPAGAAIEVIHVLDTVDYHFEFGSDYGYAEATVTSGSGAQSVNWDFSAAGEETLRMVWQAPENCMFRLRFPNDPVWNGDAYFALTFESATGGDGPDFYSFSASGTLTFASATPALFPDIGMTCLLADKNSSDLIVFAASTTTSFTTGETYEFSSITFETTVPESFAGMIVKDDVTAKLEVSSDGYIATGATYTDPNPILEIVAVPEPSSAALILIAATTGLLVTRRRQSPLLR